MLFYKRIKFNRILDLLHVTLMTENYLQERAKRGNREKYETILAKVPDVEPEAYDQLPTV